MEAHLLESVMYDYGKHNTLSEGLNNLFLLTGFALTLGLFQSLKQFKFTIHGQSHLNLSSQQKQIVYLFLVHLSLKYIHGQ